MEILTPIPSPAAMRAYLSPLGPSLRSRPSGSVSRQIRRVDYITPDPRGSLHVHCISRHDSDARRKDAIGLPGAASDFVKWSC
ncbi:hypothetical protein GEV33_008118 [Tenebrio molitor]|uniref:Uncharacterized protein n=1 Tax=Tenebrio molitor TaxID=7067 RepID=A0A8J6LCI0_TENMO|nr:hypothetical protein GEV33_008118 [Tenebrio molitor]